MSPKVLEAEALIFWFQSYDALYEDRASVHVGKGLQDDYNDAKTICWSNGMDTGVKLVDERIEVKRYQVQYPITDYTFPRETLIHTVSFDDKYIHVELTDGRKLSIPLGWLPTLRNAPLEELEKYELNPDRTMIIWDPGKCAINDELRIADYMGQPGDRIGSLPGYSKS